MIRADGAERIRVCGEDDDAHSSTGNLDSPRYKHTRAVLCDPGLNPQPLGWFQDRNAVIGTGISSEAVNW
jgi:hypothetical protein